MGTNHISETLQVELSRRSSQVLSISVDGQCDKLLTVVGHQFITLTVYIDVQHGGREAPRREVLSAEAETCFILDGFFLFVVPCRASPFLLTIHICASHLTVASVIDKNEKKQRKNKEENTHKQMSCTYLNW